MHTAPLNASATAMGVCRATGKHACALVCILHTAVAMCVRGDVCACIPRARIATAGQAHRHMYLNMQHRHTCRYPRH